MRHKSYGFTLIELLVVISIVGLLSSLSVVSFGIARTSARKTAHETLFSSVVKAVESFRLAEGTGRVLRPVGYGVYASYDSFSDPAYTYLGDTPQSAVASDRGVFDAMFSGSEDTEVTFTYGLRFTLPKEGAQYTYYIEPGLVSDPNCDVALSATTRLTEDPGECSRALSLYLNQRVSGDKIHKCTWQISLFDSTPENKECHEEDWPPPSGSG